MDFSEEIDKLCADNESGSARILHKTIDVCENYLDKGTAEKGLFIDKLNMLFSEHAGMLVLFHFINALFISIEESGDDWNGAALKFIRNYKWQWQDPVAKIAGNFPESGELARKIILVHSNSSMVTGFFGQLSARKIFPRIFQTESRPVNEGRLQAQHLAELGFRVNFITDTAIGRFMEEIDLCLLGADAIWEDHFVNKCGSLLYATAFKEAGKAVQVLADSRKILSREKIPDSLYQKMHSEPPKSPTEVWRDAPAGINVRNYYFENIPLGLVSYFHLEDGTFRAKKLKNLTKEQRLSNLFNFEQHPDF